MKYLKIFTLFFILLITQAGYSQSTAIDSLIKIGIDLSIQQKYTAAESVFTKIIRLDSTNPRGYFFLAASIQSKMMDFETDRWEHQFLSLLQQTENLAHILIKKNSNDVWAHFFLGSAYSYRAFYIGKKRRYVSAIRYAMSGISELNKVIELDSTLYDAYFGIGSYKYWRSKYTRYLNWLPLLKDERETGISLVKLSAIKGEFTNYAAINGLIWILIDCGRVSEALKWAQIGLKKYPQSRFFLWGAAKSYFNLQQYELAIKYYKIILTAVQQQNFNNHYNEIICDYKIAQCFFELQQYHQAAIFCDKISALKISSHVKKRLHKIFNKVQNLKIQISKKLISEGLP